MEIPYFEIYIRKMDLKRPSIYQLSQLTFQFVKCIYDS